MLRALIVLLFCVSTASLAACGGSGAGPGASSASSSGKSYAGFHSSYKPHNKRPGAEVIGVKIMEAMDSAKGAQVMEVWIKDPSDKNKKAFGVSLTGVPREKAGELLDNMDPALAAQGLNMLVDDMALDVLWYAKESTFNNLAGNVRALK